MVVGCADNAITHSISSIDWIMLFFKCAKVSKTNYLPNKDNFRYYINFTSLLELSGKKFISKEVEYIN